MNGQSASRRLVRLPAYGKLGGVCAGLAEYLDADVTLVRLAWVTGTVVSQVSVLDILGPTTIDQAVALAQMQQRRLAG